MRKVLISNPEEVKLVEYEDQNPNGNEVKLDVKYCGICGSDVHAFFGKHPFIETPITPGHEIGAKIMDIGSNVEGLEIGQKVTFIPQKVDNECYNCKIGRYNICENLQVYGAQIDGAMAETFNAPANLVIPLPDNFDLKKAAMIEPLTVAVHAVKILNKVEDKNAVVLGAGTIGLLIMQVLKTFGVPNIMITDIRDQKLELSEKIGADITLNPNEKELTKNFLKSKFGDRGAGVIFEAVGVEKTIRQAINLVRKGGKIIVVGVFRDDSEIQMGLIQDKEIDMEGSLMYLKEDFKDAINLIEEKSVELLPMISKIYKMSNIRKAFAKAASSSKTSPKILVNMEK